MASGIPDNVQGGVLKEEAFFVLYPACFIMTFVFMRFVFMRFVFMRFVLTYVYTRLIYIINVGVLET